MNPKSRLFWIPAFAGMTAIAVSFLTLERFVFAFDFNNLDYDKVASGGTKLFKAAVGLSDADEEKIGREVAANLAARYGLVDNAAEVHYLNLVGQTVVKHCPRTTIPYHFAILKTKEVNALAAPGGYIFITQGLLDSLQNEAELAGVLAHEVSHVTQRHIVKAIRQSNLVGAGQDLAAATGNDVSKFGQISDFSINLLSNGLSRGDELEADQLGTILAAKVGYNPLGLRESIQRLGDKGDSSVMAQFNKTHPATQERVHAINQAISHNHLSDKGATLPDRFKKGFSQV